MIKHFRLDEVKTRKVHYALLLIGFVRIEQPGDYTFYCGSNDGSVLTVDETRLIENDDLHGYRERSGKIHLSKGVHRIEVRYFQGGGGRSLKVSWQGPGFQKKELEIIN